MKFNPIKQDLNFQEKPEKPDWLILQVKGGGGDKGRGALREFPRCELYAGRHLHGFHRDE